MLKSEPFRFADQTMRVLASARDTGGIFGVVEVESPRGSGPLLHLHEREDEAFYILEGSYSVWVGDERLEAEAGSWLFGPRGVQHTYAVRSERGRHLVIVTPAGFEGFFAEAAGAEAADEPPDRQRLEEIALAYGLQTLGPNPAA